MLDGRTSEEAVMDAAWGRLRRPEVQASTHEEQHRRVRPARPCSGWDLFHSSRGLQCGNCLWVVR